MARLRATAGVRTYSCSAQLIPQQAAVAAVVQANGAGLRQGLFEQHDAVGGGDAQVELMTGEKTVLQYLLKPLYKTREALREP